jgi:hypothetical protein
MYTSLCHSLSLSLCGHIERCPSLPRHGGVCVYNSFASNDRTSNTMA